MKICYSIAICLIFSIFSISQTIERSFTLSGKINCDSGQAKLIPVASEDYYASKQIFAPVDIRDGQFSFQGSYSFPQAFILRVDSAGTPIYMSEIFFIASGKQEIRCNVFSTWETPLIRNSVMQEYQGKYSDGLVVSERLAASLKKESDSLQKEYSRGMPVTIKSILSRNRNSLDSIANLSLYNYVKCHPRSYVAMWMLAQRVDKTYNPIFDSTFQQFDHRLKSSSLGVNLNKNLIAKKLVRQGQLFPTLKVFDTLMKKQTVILSTVDSYTLVDFWFSHCNPCISQFPKLTDLYCKYGSKRFNIIGISVDMRQNIPAWKAVISKYNLPWMQYLDLDAKIASMLGIRTYPTNFLLNEKGEILRIDMSMEELDIFLEKSFGVLK